ncbi:beta-phosphoglucomutase family hydrolase [Vibrio paucivorans]|uniref:Beta-phosphoglucomutase family hydrolase n=1 Tax=Vibrio paucivorans TaxID=2829489 RepID=A0A9X3CIM7_9VIBR|nr:beta-phosphoglucomutase family hydrolase [Vibrio paucivorans]MCW8336134.1 beta-phosphoglucomutase family hydrolase [Vibrio paucivorans]
MYIDLEKYQGLIFDMDGTLIDTMPAHLEAWSQTAEHFKFPFTKEWLHSLGGMPSVKIVGEINRKHGMALIPREVSEFKMSTFASFEDFGAIIPCTNHVLNEFYGKKKMAVGTGSQRDSANRLLDTTGIINKLDAVVTATDVDKHKPEPDTFLLAAEKLGLEPQQCVVFEDTALGKQAAHAAGMDCVMVEGDKLVFYPLP